MKSLFTMAGIYNINKPEWAGLIIAPTSKLAIVIFASTDMIGGVTFVHLWLATGFPRGVHTKNRKVIQYWVVVRLYVQLSFPSQGETNGPLWLPVLSCVYPPSGDKQQLPLQSSFLSQWTAIDFLSYECPLTDATRTIQLQSSFLSQTETNGWLSLLYISL